MKKKILLYGFYSQGNFGDDALLDAIIENMKKHTSYKLSFEVAVRHPSAKMNQLFGIKTIQNLEYSHRNESEGRWLQGFNTDDGDKYKSFLKKIIDSDLIIIGPGQWLVEIKSDALWKGILAQFDALTELCSIAGVQSYGIALTCESISSPFSLLRIQNILNKLTALSFRDSRSARYLNEQGISLPNYATHNDLAFASVLPTNINIHKVLRENKISLENRGFLGMAIHSAYWAGDLENRITEIISELIINWIKTTGKEVLMIPQSINTDDPHADDRLYQKKILAHLPEKYRVKIHHIKTPISFKECQLLYSLCDVSFCTRMHGAIFSILQNTPPLLLEFEHKRKYCFELAGLDSFLCSINTPINILCRRLIELSKSTSIRQDLTFKKKELHDDALQHIRIACNLLNRNSTKQQKWAQKLME